MSKEIPILYSTEMIRAKLAGRKTQTRRTSKLSWVNEDPNDWEYVFEDGQHMLFNKTEEGLMVIIKCPYGEPGDILWARETHYYEKYFNGLTENTFVRYKADMGDEPVAWNWHPNIFLHKEHCRIWDRVINIRVERLQDISEEDAIAEGIEKMIFITGEHVGWKNYTPKKYQDKRLPHLNKRTPVESYRTLWESVNGAGSWDLNPWVWVITTENISINGREK